MATLPSPRTWTVGELLTAAKLNTDLRDGLNFLLAPPLALLLGIGTTNISTATQTPLPWTTELIDRDGGHDNVTNNTRYTAKTAGYYEMDTAIAWGSQFTAAKNHAFRKNGSTELVALQFGDLTASNTFYPALTLSGRAFLAVNDYVEVTAYQASGSTQGLTFANTGVPRFEIKWCSS